MRNRSELVFRYRMVGLQPDWVDSRSGTAVFSALPPGSYTFEAMASNPSLNAYSATVQLNVTILPPWWRSNWFFGLCGLAFLLLVFLAVWIYERQLRARSRHLEWVVSERTKELEASREQLRIQATHDGLTGMLNRDTVLRALSTELDRAHRDRKAVAVALVDLDHFKLVNDQYGHLAGDEALLWFAGVPARPHPASTRNRRTETREPPQRHLQLEGLCQRRAIHFELQHGRHRL
jgi:hypothetical protein